MESVREQALDPSSTISKLICDFSIKEYNLDNRFKNIDSDINTFVSGYKRYVEAVLRRKITPRRKKVLEELKFETLIPYDSIIYYV